MRDQLKKLVHGLLHAILVAYSNVHNIVTNSHGAAVKQYDLNKSLNRDLNKVLLF